MHYKEWKRDSLDTLILKLGTDKEKGLKSAVARDRLKTAGKNKLQKKVFPWYSMLLEQLQSPFIVLLLLASAFSFVLSDVMQGLIILFMLGVNVVLELYQELSSSRTLQLLQKLLISQILVIRDGKKKFISEENVVPGDLVVLTAGDKISADMRLINAEGLLVDEAALTGESDSIVKSAKVKIVSKSEAAVASVFAGTVVVAGHGTAVVTATGMNTELGEIAILSSESSVSGIFKKDLNTFTWWMLLLICGAFCFVFFFKWFFSLGDYQLFDVIVFALVVAVSITPESLPVIITFSLSRAARSLANKKVIVKKLSVLNDLGSVQVLCVDKTGTLTENRLKVISVWKNSQEVLLQAFLGSAHFHSKTFQDPLDKALWKQLQKKKLYDFSGYQLIKLLPFDSVKRRSGALVQKDGVTWLIYRGAFEEIVKQCAKKPSQDLFDWYNEQKKSAHKVFAVAKKRVCKQDSDGHFPDGEMIFVGCFACVDPIKKSVKTTLKKAESFSVKIKVISGDAPEVVSAVGQKVGLLAENDTVILGDDFEAMSEQERWGTLENCYAFARVNPLQKHLIVQTLEKKYTVAFLGDGINDAPVLKLAHVGIAVKGSVAIAQEAADMLLMNKSIESIIDALESGRRALVNAKKYLVATLSFNIANGVALVMLLAFSPFLPVTAAQLLLMHSLVDLPMFGLAVDRVDIRRLSLPTRFSFTPIMIMLLTIGLTSSLFMVLLFTLLNGYSLASLQTVWFLMTAILALFILFTSRTPDPIWYAERPSRSFAALSFGVIIMAFFLPQVSLVADWFGFGAIDMALMVQGFGLLAVTLLIVELMKHVVVRFFRVDTTI